MDALAGLFWNCRMVLCLFCGHGDLLSALKQNQVPAVGWDPDEKLVEECRQQGLHAYVGDRAGFAWHAGKFDGAYLPMEALPNRGRDGEALSWISTITDLFMPGGLLAVSAESEVIETIAASVPGGFKVFAVTESAIVLEKERKGISAYLSSHATLSRRADLFMGCKQVCELGSGHGHFLDALHVRGVAALGIEANASLVEAGQGRGLEIELGGVDRLREHEARFDGFYCGRLPGANAGGAAASMAAIAGASVAALQPGGRWVAYASGKGSADLWRAALESSGLEGMGQERILSQPAGWLLLGTKRSDAESDPRQPATESATESVAESVSEPVLGRASGIAVDLAPIPGCAGSPEGESAEPADIYDLDRFERRVFSQGGEDGVLEQIFAKIGTTNRFYVEFGCGDGLQCNTAHLRRQGWQGLLMDGMAEPAAEDAVIHAEWISAENIVALFDKYEVPPEPDLLSIDIDGNDYWVWQALPHRARVVIIEYNANLGCEQALTIPYNPEHRWDGSDYYGASLPALESLGRAKGYRLIYCNAAGVNAFFVREDLLPSLPERSISEIYRPPNYWYRAYRQVPDLARPWLQPSPS